MKHRLAALGIALAMSVPGSAFAETWLVESDSFELSIGGYLRGQSGRFTPSYSIPSPLNPDVELNEPYGVHIDVLRLEWTATFAENFTLDLHQRLLWSMQSAEPLLASGVGIGATAAPDRTLDLSTSIIDEDGLSLNHDVDRLALRFYANEADVAIGRQAITWGNSLLFPVVDIWNVFSPFELDDTEKRGIDAIRVITSFGYTTEVEFVVADRGEIEDLSGGVRASFYLDSGDVYAAGGKTWDEVFLATGYSHYLDRWSLRAEGFLPFDYDDGELDLPRLTLGADYLSNDGMLSFEAHFNGAGAEPDRYLEDIADSEPHSRGEVYLLGRLYGGISGFYQITELLVFQSAALINVLDPSVIFTPTFAYSLAQDIDVAFGSFVGVGAHPGLSVSDTGVPEFDVPSEFSAVNAFTYLQMTAYY